MTPGLDDGDLDDPLDGSPKTALQDPEDPGDADFGDEDAEGLENDVELDRHGLPTTPGRLEDMTPEQLRQYYRDVADYGTEEALRRGVQFQSGFTRAMQKTQALNRKLAASMAVPGPNNSSAIQPPPQGFAQQPPPLGYSPAGQLPYPGTGLEDLDPVTAQHIQALQAEVQEMRGVMTQTQLAQMNEVNRSARDELEAELEKAADSFPALMGDEAVQAALLQRVVDTRDRDIEGHLRRMYPDEVFEAELAKRKRAAARAKRPAAGPAPPSQRPAGVRGPAEFIVSDDPEERRIQMAKMLQDAAPEVPPLETPRPKRSTRRRSRGRGRQ